MSPEQAGLLAKARESLNVARMICERGSHGFAASRAYYAMFYVVEALLLGEGLEFKRHSAVIAAFGERFQKTGRVPAGFHRMLITAEECRELADYEISTSVSARLAQEQIDSAQMFLDLAEKMLTTPEDKPSQTTQ
jgi:uncharacterized protein (UPF0332 family)